LVGTDREVDGLEQTSKAILPREKGVDGCHIGGNDLLAKHGAKGAGEKFGRSAIGRGAGGGDDRPACRNQGIFAGLPEGKP